MRLALSTALLWTFVLAAPSLAFAADGEILGAISAPVPKHRAGAVAYVKGAGHGTSSKSVTMDQRGLVFIPRILPIQKGTTVKFLNSDQVGHNVFTPDGDTYDLGTWPQGEVKSYKFGKTGVFRQLCRVHADMIAYIVVLDTKFFAVSDKAGKFKIKGLPPGTYTLGVWHEKLGAPDLTVEVKAGAPAKVDITLGAKR